MNAPAPKRKYKKFTIPMEELYLGSKPIPTGEPRHIEEIDGTKRVHCRRYANCLTFAAARKWPGFSCIACKIEDPLPLEQQKRDLVGLSALLAALDLKTTP